MFYNRVIRWQLWIYTQSQTTQHILTALRYLNCDLFAFIVTLIFISSAPTNLRCLHSTVASPFSRHSWFRFSITIHMLSHLSSATNSLYTTSILLNILFDSFEIPRLLRYPENIDSCPAFLWTIGTAANVDNLTSFCHRSSMQNEAESIGVCHERSYLLVTCWALRLL